MAAFTKRYQVDAAVPRWHSRSVLARLSALAILLGLAAGMSIEVPYQLELRSQRSLFKQQATHLVDLQTALLEQEMQSIVSDLHYLAGLELLEALAIGNETGRDAVIANFVRFCVEKKCYDQVRLLDLQGQEVIRVDYGDGAPQAMPATRLQSKARRYYFRQALALKAGQTFVSPFDLNVEHEQIERPLKPVIRFATPIVDSAGTTRGLLVLNCLGARILNQLDAAAALFPGDVWLLNEAGFYLRGPDAASEWNFMLGDGDRSFAADHGAAWKQIADRDVALVENAEGLYAVRRIDASDFLGRSQRSASAAAPQSDPFSGPRLILTGYLPQKVVLSQPRRLFHRLLGGVGIAFVFSSGIAWRLAYLHELRRHDQSLLQDAYSGLRQMTARLLTAQEDERRRLSRDLHDDVGQLVASAALDLELARTAPNPRQSREWFGRASAAIRTIGEKIHQTAADMRPSLLDDVGLRSAIADLLQQFQARHRLACTAHLDLRDDQVDGQVAENVYRILQEALTNVVRHSGAGEASVEVSADQHSIRLSVQDGGCGFAAQPFNAQRLGLLGMRERAELLGGTFDVQSSVQNGVRITAIIPFPSTKEVAS